jgi:hypothetical protein
MLKIQLKKKMLLMGKIIVSGFIAVLILSAFCFVYYYIGIRMKNESGSTDCKWNANEWKATMKEGYAWMKMDNAGFNNAYEPKSETIDILLVGSSHMLGLNVAADENVGYLLNELLPEYTYNIGMVHHTIDICVNNMADAVAEFKPTEYVILETGSIEMELEEMQAVLDGNTEKLNSYDPGLLVMLMNTMPALKTIYSQLHEWVDMDVAEAGTEQTECEEQPGYLEDYIEALNGFLAKANEPVLENGAKLIIFYHPNSMVDESGNYADDTDAEALELFRIVCERNGIIFVDMTENFKKLYEEEHQLPHGFVNTAVGTGHLNAYGHAVIAETLAQTIIEDKESGKK